MDKVKKWIGTALVKEDLKDYKLNVYKSSGKGEGFVGDITFVQVDATTKNNEKKTYELLVKATGRYSDEAKPPMYDIVFQREMFFYNVVAPSFRKFELDHQVIKPFASIPECFLTQSVDGYDMIIMKNLQVEGFELHSLSEQMSWKHLELLAENYGHFHAISMSLKHQRPEEFQRLSGGLTDVMSEILKAQGMKMFDQILEKNLDLLTKFNELETKRKLEVLHTANPLFLRDSDHSSNPNAIITHGDCWCNNFMFKYRDDKQQDPQEVRILDWQVIRLASPAFDLAYSFHCAVRVEELHRHEEFIDLYYNSFCNHMKALGSDPEKLYPKSELLKDWQYYGIIGLIMASAIYQRACTDNDGIAKEEDCKEFADMIQFQVKDEQRLITMLKALVNYMEDRSVIN